MSLQPAPPKWPHPTHWPGVHLLGLHCDLWPRSMAKLLTWAPNSYSSLLWGLSIYTFHGHLNSTRASLVASFKVTPPLPFPRPSQAIELPSSALYQQDLHFAPKALAPRPPLYLWVFPLFTWSTAQAPQHPFSNAFSVSPWQWTSNRCLTMSSPAYSGNWLLEWNPIP